MTAMGSTSLLQGLCGCYRIDVAACYRIDVAFTGSMHDSYGIYVAVSVTGSMS